MSRSDSIFGSSPVRTAEVSDDEMDMHGVYRRLTKIGSRRLRTHPPNWQFFRDFSLPIHGLFSSFKFANDISAIQEKFMAQEIEGSEDLPSLFAIPY